MPSLLTDLLSHIILTHPRHNTRSSQYIARPIANPINLSHQISINKAQHAISHLRYVFEYIPDSSTASTPRTCSAIIPPSAVPASFRILAWAACSKLSISVGSTASYPEAGTKLGAVPGPISLSPGSTIPGQATRPSWCAWCPRNSRRPELLSSSCPAASLQASSKPPSKLPAKVPASSVELKVPASSSAVGPAKALAVGLELESEHEGRRLGEEVLGGNRPHQTTS